MKLKLNQKEYNYNQYLSLNKIIMKLKLTKIITKLIKQNKFK